MDRMVYVGMTGAKQVMQAQAMVSHNLANVSTPGFRADLHAFGSEPVRGPGFQSRVNAVARSVGWDPVGGRVATTERALDVAVEGRGWIAVQAADGSEALTRRGDLRITELGMLENGAGQLVLGEAGPLAIPEFSEIVIGTDGTVSVVPLGENPETLVDLDRIKLVAAAPEDLEKGLDGALRLRAGAEAVPDAEVKLISGALEGSNVNTAKALIDMIRFARQFEMQIRGMHVAAENAERAAELMRLR